MPSNCSSLNSAATSVLPSGPFHRRRNASSWRPIVPAWDARGKQSAGPKWPWLRTRPTRPQLSSSKPSDAPDRDTLSQFNSRTGEYAFDRADRPVQRIASVDRSPDPRGRAGSRRTPGCVAKHSTRKDESTCSLCPTLPPAPPVAYALVVPEVACRNGSSGNVSCRALSSQSVRPGFARTIGC